MNDLADWTRACGHIDRMLAGMPEGERLELATMAMTYRRLKEQLADLGERADAAALCRACRGACCENGKYRMNVFDALALRLADRPMPRPDFDQRPLCPYGSAGGCHLSAAFRPADCVTFVCNSIDARLDRQTRELMEAVEEQLRECLRQAERSIGTGLARPLLLFGHQTNFGETYGNRQ